MIQRIPPQNIDAELAVLGAMLVNKDALITGQDMLRDRDFYREANAVIFNAINHLQTKGKEVDALTVVEELRRMGQLENIGGISYVMDLPNHVVAASDIAHHAQIVLEKSRLRHLIIAADAIAGEAYAGEGEVIDIIDSAERRILEVAKDERRQDMTPLGQVIQTELEEISSKAENRSGITGLASGFTGLDRLTGGFQKSDLILVAARPSMGKTAFTLNIAQYAAMELGKKVAFFSLEMSKEQLGKRILCSTAVIDSHKLQTGQITSREDWNNIVASAARLYKTPLYIDDTPGLTVAEMRSKARRLQSEHGLDLIVVDYLQLMQGRGNRNGDNRQQEISDISRSLKGLARELKVPVIALSQLSRSVESRQDKRPMLSDLRESGSLEQDADVVAFLYREGYYHPEYDEAQKGITEVIIAKHRNGAVGMVKLFFRAEITRFLDMERFRTEPDE